MGFSSKKCSSIISFLVLLEFFKSTYNNPLPPSNVFHMRDSIFPSLPLHNLFLLVITNFTRLFIFLFNDNYIIIQLFNKTCFFLSSSDGFRDWRAERSRADKEYCLAYNITTGLSPHHWSAASCYRFK